MPKAHLEAHNIKIYLSGTCFRGSLISPKKMIFFFKSEFRVHGNRLKLSNLGTKLSKY